MGAPPSNASHEDGSAVVPKRDSVGLKDVIDGSSTLEQKVRTLNVRCDSEEATPSGADLAWRLAELEELLDDQPQQVSPGGLGGSVGEGLLDDSEAGPGRTRLVLTRSLDDGSIWAIIGDLHGDYPALTAILRSLFPQGMADEEAERVHLVFLGDLLDRGAKDFQVLHLVLCLRRLFGDRLTLLLGNHDVLILDDEGRLRATVKENAGTYGLFARRYHDVIEPDLSQILVSFFDGLPRLVMLEHSRGRLALVHGGLPPAFLFNRFESLDEMMDLENARKAFLWGRPYPMSLHIDEPRPDRTYDYKRFYREDSDEFRDRFGIDILVRGHDAVEPGYESRWNGTVLTVFSSGAGSPAGIGEIGAYADDVVLPRYLVVDAARVFTGAPRAAGRPDVDGGIGVREVFARDVVLLLSSARAADFAPGGLLSSTALSLQESLRWSYGAPIPLHLLERRGYTMEADAKVDFLAPSSGEFDEVLDGVRTGRLAYVLEVQLGQLRFSRWRPPEAKDGAAHHDVVMLAGSPASAESLARCAGMIAEDLELVRLADSESTGPAGGAPVAGDSR